MRKLIVCCQGREDNIHCICLNDITGELSHLWSSNAGENPTFAVEWDEMLLAVNETEHRSALSLWHIGGDGLSHVGSAYGPGGGSCHVALWPDGKYATVSNYASGSFATFSLNKTGGVRFESSFSPPPGANAGKSRAEPHAHACVFSGGNALGADLGKDAVYLFRAEKGRLSCSGIRNTAPGCGPRHLCVNETKDKVYLLTEKSSEVLVFSRSHGDLTAEQTISVHKGVRGCAAAELALTEDGKWLLCSVRGGDHMAVMGVRRDGTLGEPDFFPLRIAGPRHFLLLRGNAFLVCAGQYSNTVASYRLEDGKLSGPLSVLDYDSPVCLVEC